MRILLAYDGSPYAQRALEQTIRRPWPRGSSLHVVMVLEEPFALEPPYEVEGTGPLIDQVRKGRRSAALLRMKKLQAKLRSRTKLKISTSLLEGNPKKELLGAIGAWKPDLVIVGSHGRRGFMRLFMGSVSHALMMNAPCSVEVVKLPPGS